MEDNKIDGGGGVRNTSLFAKYANEITAITTSAAADAAAAVATTDRRRRKSNKIVDEHRPPESIADAIAFTAKQNLTSMKSNVDKTLQEVTSVQRQLSNYQQFIEKKRLQRIQCVRDIKSHCCKCQGPHIAKPPFCCNSKNHRRDPIHTLRQGANCKFLKRKRAELKWLDETLYKYPMNEKRFEQQIATFETESLRQKEEMKEALANSLRLMEIAVNLPMSSDD
jgi:hypothetical protein